MQQINIEDTFFSKNRSLNCRGKLLSLHQPRVMGILNVTPDSFYDGGWHEDPSAALEHARKMVSQGADIIDIGAASSRPGAALSNAAEEIKKLVPVVSSIRQEFPDLIISIDTYHASVANEMITNFGADMINDISAGAIDPEMIPVIAQLNVPYIIMHMKGVPGNMQQNPEYDNITDEIIQYFSGKVNLLQKKGISDILIDPGFGFGKTLDNNYKLLAQIYAFNMFELPIVAGISRKSMVYNLLGSTSEESLTGTTALHMILLEKGVNIIRVHDVKEAREAITIYNKTCSETKQSH
ncbi:MAG: dihydropteroate synthase [Bacteroidales bacterium]